MKEDTELGELLDLAFKCTYGDGFEWEKAIISRENGNYIVEITDASNRTNKEGK